MGCTIKATCEALAVENGPAKKSVEGFLYYCITFCITVLHKLTNTFFYGNQSLRTGAA